MKRSFNILKVLFFLLVFAVAAPLVTEVIINNQVPELLGGLSLAALPILPAFDLGKKQLTSLELKERRGEIHDYLQALNNKAKEEKRDLTPEENREFELRFKEFDTLGDKLKEVEAEERQMAESVGAKFRKQNGTFDNEQWYDTRSGESIPVYTKGDYISRGEKRDSFNLGKAVKALVVGNWIGAENEQRALSTSVGSGSVMVPLTLQPKILDLIRDKALCFNAGAKLVMMPSETLSIARITGDPTIQVKAQNDAFDEGTMSFDAISLKAFTIGTRIVMSRELAADAPNAAQAIQNALIQALALKLDKLALYGAGTTEPLGVQNLVGTSAIDLNGGSELGYDNLIDLWTMLATNNCDPTAYFIAPRDYAKMSKERVANGYLVPPVMLEGKLIPATSIPIDLGATQNQSIVLAGDFTKMLVGVREDIRIEVSTEGDYFNKHQVGIKATLRADIAFERASQFGKIVEIAAPSA